ncbi:MAG: energy transducer TonB [Verrucomicrobiota bacterium]|nr:energy transducer TonB [Verrucomicrobiota bacterium]
MNAAPDSPPHPTWSPARWLTVIALIFGAHVVLIFVFGAWRPPPVRPVEHVPALQLAGAAGGWLGLNDPTLFALPHAQGFAGEAWMEPPRIQFTQLEWTERPRWLELSAGQLGSIFHRFMQTNRFARLPLELKVAPRLSVPVLPVQQAPVQASTVRVEGDLARRSLLTPLNPPSVPFSDVIAPSRVQVVVDAAGRVVSDALLSSSGVAAADGNALALAQAARFAPLPRADVSVLADLASQLTFGQLVFDWHTVPPPATNAPATHEPVQ